MSIYMYDIFMLSNTYAVHIVSYTLFSLTICCLFDILLYLCRKYLNNGTS